MPTVLTGKQKSELRSLGQKLAVAVTVGKGGAADSLVRELALALGNRELVKVRLPATTREDRHEMTVRLAVACEAELVGEVGHTALLYRANERLDPSKRVIVDAGREAPMAPTGLCDGE